MAEYIFKCDNDMRHPEWREEIVRCKDCRQSFDPHEMNEGYIDEAKEYPGSLICGYMEMDVEPDGFCKWGERNA